MTRDMTSPNYKMVKKIGNISKPGPRTGSGPRTPKTCRPTGAERPVGNRCAPATALIICLLDYV